jgi:hypothetical protein
VEAELAEYTDEVQVPCERRAVFAIDVLDRDRRLLDEHISVEETLEDCSCGPQKCALLEDWINKQRAIAGVDPLDGGTIAPSTTIKEVIGFVCV